MPCPAVSDRLQIAFVDAALPGLAAQLERLDRAIEVVLLGATRDGVQEIAEALTGRVGIDAVHILSHGAQGSLSLGNTILDAASMADRHCAALETIGDAVWPSGDLLVYGCDFAKGDAGRHAVRRLAEITGAEVAASTDVTGHIDLGGNWELDVTTGTISTERFILTQWHGLLADTDGDSVDDALDLRRPWRRYSRSGEEPHNRVQASSRSRLRPRRSLVAQARTMP